MLPNQGIHSLQITWYTSETTEPWFSPSPRRNRFSTRSKNWQSAGIIVMPTLAHVLTSSPVTGKR